MIIDYSKLPPHIREGMRLYIERGVVPGDFLQCVIRNDLVHAFATADSENTVAMRDIADFMFNQAPSLCWGSQERMHAWSGNGGLGGSSVIGRRPERLS